MALYAVALVAVEAGADEVEAGGALHELAVAAAHHAHGALGPHHPHERLQPPVARLQRFPAVTWKNKTIVKYICP